MLAQPAARVSAIIAEMTNQRAFTLKEQPTARQVPTQSASSALSDNVLWRGAGDLLEDADSEEDDDFYYKTEDEGDA